MTHPPRSVDGGIDEIPLPGGTPGRLFLSGKHAIGPDVEAALRRVGAASVVCLTKRDELEHRYPHYLAWLEEHAAGRAVWAPTHDLGALPATESEVLADRIVTRLSAGETVLMHCGAGVGRAGTMAVAVLMRLGVPAAEARLTVRRHRPMAGPEAGPQAELLDDLAARWSD